MAAPGLTFIGVRIDLLNDIQLFIMTGPCDIITCLLVLHKKKTSYFNRCKKIQHFQHNLKKEIHIVCLKIT